MNLNQATVSNYMLPGYLKCKVTRLEIANQKNPQGNYVLECDLTSQGAECKGKLSITEKTLGSVNHFLQAIGINPNVEFNNIDELVTKLKPILGTVNKAQEFPLIIKGNIGEKGVFASLGFSPYNAKQANMEIAEGNFEVGSPLYTKWVKASSLPSAVANSTTSAIANDDLPF